MLFDHNQFLKLRYFKQYSFLLVCDLIGFLIGLCFDLLFNGLSFIGLSLIYLKETSIMPFG